ncbi:Bug family tripartite tricarboxylate transporter substrate binding protein [Haladaptatus sp. CMAA 1911]|uniref:Bug family tripartite tricarboxylate transporter substrate binding protein n=1 Tax=unclassified Haladaptatus TaxID=2622732 RepID=UPI0037540C94
MTGNKNRITRRNFLAGAAASSSLIAGCTSSGGSGSYPSKDMSYIVPFSQGGGTDTYARKVVPEIGNELNVGVAIENVPGAASLKGTGEILREKSDGYTFGGFNPPSTPISYLVHEPSWDITNLVPVATYARTPYAIFARPELEIEGVKDLTKRYQNGDLSKFAGLARGGIVHVAANVMKSEYDLQYEKYIGYDGGGPAIKAAISGEVPVVATTDTAAMSAVDSGDLEAIAILSSEGSSVFKDAPSPSDEGLPSIDYIGQLTRCMFLPKGTDTEKRDTLEDAVKSALTHDSVQEWSDKTGNIVEFGGHKKAKKALNGSIETIPKKVDLKKIASE